jgi:hypothetical protein
LLTANETWSIMEPPLSHRHCEERSDEAIQLSWRGKMDCFAEFIIGRRFASTRWLAMTSLSNPHTGAPDFTSL